MPVRLGKWHSYHSSGFGLIPSFGRQGVEIRMAIWHIAAQPANPTHRSGRHLQSKRTADADTMTEVIKTKTNSKSPDVPELEDPSSAKESSPAKGLAFWLVISSLCLIGFTASLDGSIIAIALPKISTELAAQDKYVGIANSFVLAQTVIQPAFAQICGTFGCSRLVHDPRVSHFEE
ncbi:hypothetical protein CC80DRAFT_530626 [Byssothecium circinans]|uniref:Major facilitator superfamily (MFS) profile domain-containing protein n=1 Tax=Byssothecium circinans TaxID=147558 RepID=A0A6A5UCL2_9PLEO|nr:hypothetical protein CC80DRAFT_530626 [Byssothecium circinans]